MPGLSPLRVAPLLTVIAWAFAPHPASAAVRNCYPRIVTSAIHPTSEFAARQQAVAAWTAQARHHGERFTRFALAEHHAVACERTSAGFACTAAGAPCTITQNPDRPPVPPR